MGPNAWLWLVPVKTALGDGITFPTRIPLRECTTFHSIGELWFIFHSCRNSKYKESTPRTTWRINSRSIATKSARNPQPNTDQPSAGTKRGACRLLHPDHGEGKPEPGLQADDHPGRVNDAEAGHHHPWQWSCWNWGHSTGKSHNQSLNMRFENVRSTLHRFPNPNKGPTCDQEMV